MNIEQLQRFLVVAECLNFTAAAERLYIGQSTISRQIASLEQELGVVLLIRGPRSVELTKAGEVLYREGTKLLQHMDRVRDRVIEAGKGVDGKLRIATVPAYFSSLNAISLRLMETYPNLKLRLSYSKYLNVCQDIEMGGADIGVSYSFLDPLDERYESIALEPSRFYVVCRRDHPLTVGHENGIYQDELRDTDIIFGRNSMLMMSNPQPYRGDPQIPEAADDRSMEGDLVMLQHSDQIMILPGCSIQATHNNLAAIPILDEHLLHQVILFYRRDSISSTTQRFLEIVHSYLEAQNAGR